MFDFSEILIIFALALVVLGPKKLPGAAAQIGRWLGRARAMARQFREQLEEEVNSVKDLDTPKRPSPPLYTPPPTYTAPAHPTATESPSEWLAQTGTGATTAAPPTAPAAPHAHEDPQTSDRSEHERGT